MLKHALGLLLTARPPHAKGLVELVIIEESGSLQHKIFWDFTRFHPIPSFKGHDSRLPQLCNEPRRLERMHLPLHQCVRYVIKINSFVHYIGPYGEVR